jgi:LDH2 family malate/lactate/ureidoglycolate dehydrogenase
MVALITTQGSASMAPVGGSEPIMSNAPVGIGIPSGQLPPIILDMSLTQSSASPVIEALLEGRLVPPGIVLDERGLPTTNPKDVFTREGDPPQWTYRGSLVPIGGYKGYGLATAMMVLSSLLVGARPAWERMSSPNRSDQQPSPERPAARKGAGGGSSKPGTLPARPGTLFICLDVAAFTPLDVFRAEVDRFLTRITSSRKAGDDEIGYPGLRSGRLQAARRVRNVVPLAANTPIALNELARELGLDDRISDPVPMGKSSV